MPKDHTTYSTVHELVTGPKFHLAIAQVNSAALYRDITRCLDGLRRVKTPVAGVIVAHFQGILDRADIVNNGRAYFDSELKRVALGLSCVSIGDLSFSTK
jgi:hypothetical protein